MAKGKVASPARRRPRRGPYIAVATLCERVLNESDNVQSAIRIVDQVTLEPLSASPPPGATVLPAIFHGALLIMLKTGDAPGRYMITIEAEAPSGKRVPFNPTPVELPDKPNGGASVVFQLAIALTETGLFRFNVRLDGRLLTVIPLLVQFAAARPIESIVVEPPGSPRQRSRRADGASRATRPRSSSRQ